MVLEVVGEVTYLLLGMACAIDLSNLSLDELYVLAGRVECRIKALSASTEHTAATAPADPWAASEEIGLNLPDRAWLQGFNRNPVQHSARKYKT